MLWFRRALVFESTHGTNTAWRMRVYLRMMYNGGIDNDDCVNGRGWVTSSFLQPVSSARRCDGWWCGQWMRRRMLFDHRCHIDMDEAG